jgi:transcriptional regulator with XRE-family HTH domain
MGDNRDENQPCEAEIVAPAAPARGPGRRLTRRQVAQRLGLSLSTVRRMEGGELKPIIDERGVRYFEATEIQAVFVRVRRTRKPERERADGTLAAAAFELFQRGADVVAVVKELREAPEKIETLLGHWKRLRGAVLLDVKSLASIESDLNADALTDENALLSAVAEFKKRNAHSCVLCERETAYWCRNCAQAVGRAEAQEREARKLF